MTKVTYNDLVKLADALDAPVAQPVLVEGNTYRMEINGRLVQATFLRFVDDVPGLCGFSFQIGKHKQFITAQNLISSNGYLIAVI